MQRRRCWPGREGSRRHAGACSPASALAAAARLGLSGRLFNSEAFGGYLAFRGIPTFIDGRIELFGNAFLARYVDAENGDERVLGDLLDRWRISWTLLEARQGAVSCLDRLRGWRSVYGDARAIIYVRTGRQQISQPSP